jgi:D-alanine-D-alanine ligase
MRKLTVTVLVDWNTVPDADPEFLADPVPAVTEYHVINALRELGHRVCILGVRNAVDQPVNALAEQRPDLVFNLVEVFHGDRGQDRNIAALLELLRIPYTGSGPEGLLLCRDKALCKRLLNAHRIRVPAFFTAAPGRKTAMPARFPLPAIVKPLYGDGSDGISNASLVDTPEKLVERVGYVHHHWRQPAIVEEYIEGREMYVALLGNRRPIVLPPRELFLDQAAENGPSISTYHVKFNPAYQEKWNIHFGFAELDEGVREAVRRACRRAYRALRIRDYGRIDLRLTPDGRIVILEANPNPDLACGEEVAESAEQAAVPYRALIERIVRYAWKRAGSE